MGAQRDPCTKKSLKFQIIDFIKVYRFVNALPDAP